MKKIFLAAIAAISLGAMATTASAHGPWHDYGHDPVAAATAGGFAGTSMTGFATTAAVTQSDTGTYAATTGGDNTQAGYDAGSTGATGGQAVNLGSGSASTLLSLNASGEADASLNDVDSSASLAAGAESAGNAGLVLIQQGAIGGVDVSGDDAPHMQQNANAAGAGLAVSNIVGLTAGGNVSVAVVQTSSEVEVTTSVNP